MRCDDAYLLICDSLNQPANSAKCRAIRKHLKGCKDCAAYLESLKMTIRLYQSESEVRTPSAVHRRLMKRISGIEQRPGRKSA